MGRRGIEAGPVNAGWPGWGPSPAGSSEGSVAARLRAAESQHPTGPGGAAAPRAHGSVEPVAAQIGVEEVLERDVGLPAVRTGPQHGQQQAVDDHQVGRLGVQLGRRTVARPAGGRRTSTPGGRPSWRPRSDGAAPRRTPRRRSRHPAAVRAGSRARGTGWCGRAAAARTRSRPPGARSRHRPRWRRESSTSSSFLPCVPERGEDGPHQRFQRSWSDRPSPRSRRSSFQA